MKVFLIGFLSILCMSADTHKFYLSVTNINYSEKDDALQVTSRIFIDDLENVLEERYGIKVNLAANDDTFTAKTYIERYLRTKFLVYLDGKPFEYAFLGEKYDNDVVICYMELSKVNLESLQKMEIENKILTDIYDEQQNVVHVKWKGNKKSFILIKSNAKGMLNF